jgi:hypothetical protein
MIAKIINAIRSINETEVIQFDYKDGKQKRRARRKEKRRKAQQFPGKHV